MATDSQNSRRFDIALSFPGEHRDFMRQVADLLAREFGEERVLYDHFHDAEFAAFDTDVTLPTLYRTESELVVVFLCPEYPKKRWCGLEFRHIRQMIGTPDKKRVIFFTFGKPGDLSELGIVNGDGFIDIEERKLDHNGVVAKILKRLALNQGRTAKPEKPDIPTDISRIDHHAPEHLLGRETELDRITQAWNDPQTHILTFVAMGGEGKTSLVARWAVNCVGRAEFGCEAAFAWSFYSQGASDQSNASADLFLREALQFFGDAAMADSPCSPVDKGKRLAALLAQRRALLVLDGVEPLQYPPASPLKGELRDSGLAALLKALAVRNPGLCLVTTRFAIADLNAYRQYAPEHHLPGLARAAGVALLAKLGVNGSERERGQLVEDVRGHALSLNLLGAYLRDAHGGDIRRRDLVRLKDADLETQNGHAFHVMDAYAAWLDREPQSRPALALLRLLGLFDRPADAGCLAALWRPPAIEGLTGDLVGLNEARRNLLISRLAEAKLLSTSRDGAGRLLALDAHPLLREYFAAKLRQQQPEAWRTAHERLFRHLCATTEDKAAPSLEELQPLYQAVAHGCSAGLQQEACDKVYFARILKGTGDDGVYSLKKLGAFGTDLGAVACFFEELWHRVAPALAEGHQAWLLNEAAFRLRGVGRLAEALEPMRAGLEMRVKQENWGESARSASNLSESELTLGAVAEAVADAEQAVTYADRKGDLDWKAYSRTTLADALHQAGQREAARDRFQEAEALQAEHQPSYPLLYSVPGFRYCDLLLAAAERLAWSAKLALPGGGSVAKQALHSSDWEAARAACRAVSERAAQTLKESEEYEKTPLLDFALDHLTLARAQLYAACLNPPAELPPELRAETGAAVDNLRRAGTMHYLPRGLLTRAWLHHLEAAYPAAQEDLDEAHDIAERGPMPLYLADIYLYRARLFGTLDGYPYPWQSPAQDLHAARRLIEKHGYWRRKEELEDAEAYFRERGLLPGSPHTAA